MSTKPLPGDVTSWLVGSLDGINEALYRAYAAGPLEPFTHAQTVKPGAEVFTSGDRKIMLIRQYDVRSDTFVWRVSAQLVPSSPEPFPSNPDHTAEGPEASHGSVSGDGASPQGSEAGSGTGVS